MGLVAELNFLFLRRCSFLQKLEGVLLGLFCVLTRCFGCFLKRLIGDVLGIPHIIIGHLASAVIAHKIFLSYLLELAAIRAYDGKKHEMR